MIIAWCQQSHNSLSEENRQKSYCRGELGGCEAPELFLIGGPAHSLSLLPKAPFGPWKSSLSQPDPGELPS